MRVREKSRAFSHSGQLVEPVGHSVEGPDPALSCVSGDAGATTKSAD